MLSNINLVINLICFTDVKNVEKSLEKGMNFLLSIKGGFPTFNNQSFPFVYNHQFMNALDKKI